MGVCSTSLTEIPGSRTIQNPEESRLTDRNSVDDLAKHDVLAVKVGGQHGGDEELRSIDVGTDVGHRQEERFVVLPGERSIIEPLAVNRLTTGSVSGGEIATLDNEPTKGYSYKPHVGGTCSHTIWLLDERRCPHSVGAFPHTQCPFLQYTKHLEHILV